MDLIVSEESCNYRKMFEQVLKEHRIDVRIGFELGNPEAIKQCVRNELGIALLPRIVVEEEVQRGTLAICLLHTRISNLICNLLFILRSGSPNHC
jgi:DNA-binding transcriptional LysR family regulator